MNPEVNVKNLLAFSSTSGGLKGKIRKGKEKKMELNVIRDSFNSIFARFNPDS